MKTIRELGTKLDTWGGRRKMATFKAGWAAHTSPEIGFYMTPLTQIPLPGAG